MHLLLGTSSSAERRYLVLDLKCKVRPISLFRWRIRPPLPSKLVYEIHVDRESLEIVRMSVLQDVLKIDGSNYQWRAPDYRWSYMIEPPGLSAKSPEHSSG